MRVGDVITAVDDAPVGSVIEFHLDLLEMSVDREVEFAVWRAEGADGGRIHTDGDGPSIIEIETVRLWNFLNRPVDFLKMDIEGSEVDVLIDCADRLSNVRALFVEYHSFDGQPQRLEELLRVLTAAGFRYYVHRGDTFSPHLLVEKHLVIGLDMLVNIYGCRY